MNKTVKDWADLFIRLCIVYAVLAFVVKIVSGDTEAATTIWLAAAVSFGLSTLIWAGGKLHAWVTK